MEPEWNNCPELEDSIMLGLRQKINYSLDKFTTMHFGWLKNRTWNLRLSLSRRICYISGANLQFKLAYRGRKLLKNIMSQNKITSDDVWISQKEYLNLVLSGKICE